VRDLQRYVEEALESLYFSGARIDEHLSSFLGDQREACLAVGRDAAESAKRQLYVVGSGGSFAVALTAKYALDAVTEMPIDAVASYDLVWRRPARLDPAALVVLVSYSGETEDSVAALRAARERGARTVAIVAKPGSTMAREADVTIPYDNGAIFEIPVAAAILMVAGLAENTPAADGASALVDGLEALPAVLRRTLDVEATKAEQRARELLQDDHLFVLGAGPLSPLAYKLAMSVVMENMRIGATYSDASEWRHGPAEALERIRGTFIALLGTDASRELTLRTIRFCEENGSRVLVYDAAEYGDVHPLLTPLVMNSHTQWLIVYSAILRGITNLDDRVFMGHSVLAAGGATWP
jgi:fructoselysine-6-P-deglycase FrlB-like protein